MNKTELLKQQKYDKYFMDRCNKAAEMSYCSRLRVGVVVVKDNRTILDGWNGTITGTDNCCEESIICSKCHGCGTIDIAHGTIECKVCNGTGRIVKTKPTTIHAERNLIFYAARKGIALEGLTIYITHAPCIDCAQAIAAVGIQTIIYQDDYRTTEGVDFLKSLGKEIRQLEKDL